MDTLTKGNEFVGLGVRHSRQRRSLDGWEPTADVTGCKPVRSPFKVRGWDGLGRGGQGLARPDPKFTAGGAWAIAARVDPLHGVASKPKRVLHCIRNDNRPTGTSGLGTLRA